MRVNKKDIKIKTKKGIFGVVFKSEKGEKGYIARVKNFPEIVTGGDTFQEAKKMVKEAIEFCIECKENEHYSHTKIKRDPSFTSPARL